MSSTTLYCFAISLFAARISLASGASVCMEPLALVIAALALAIFAPYFAVEPDKDSKKLTLRSSEAMVGTAACSPNGRTASRSSNSISSTNLDAAFKSRIIKALLSFKVLGDNLIANFSGSKYRAASAVNLSKESTASSNCLDKSVTALSTASNCFLLRI